MKPSLLLLLIGGYFALLLLVSYLTKGANSNDTFFRANRRAPWYLVAFGMIGASLSGVTFISVPGWVESTQFGYFQVVLGYIVGYFVIGTILLPLYYKLNLTSIYTYLNQRFGQTAYKTGASFFILSRVVGASFRLYLVANVLQWLIFDAWGIDFWVTVVITIALIWLYTHRSGLKTLIWTDTLQTLFMLLALLFGIVFMVDALQISWDSLPEFIGQNSLSKTFFFEEWNSGNYFWKQFISGAFIAIVMTGLDQDMMQKNLSCRSLKDAQKNMFWFTIVLTVVNFIFLCLGLLLTVYAQQNNLDIHNDRLFPTVAMQSGVGLAVVFMLGLIAAAYSSADSALTSLTTSVSVDLLGIENYKNKQEQVRVRKRIHVIMSLVLVGVILIFKYWIANESVIAKLFLFAGYTYGPLLGLYVCGLFTKWKPHDRWIALVAVAAPLLSYFITDYSLSKWQFDFGFFVLILNGGLTVLGLFLFHRITKKS